MMHCSPAGVPLAQTTHEESDVTEDNGSAAEEASESSLTTFWNKLKGWFTTAKDSEAAEKAGEMAGKAWKKTKETSAKAWDKTKDVAGDVKEKVEEKMEERRDKDDGDHQDEDDEQDD